MLEKVDINQLISGALMLGYAMAGTFFLRFWRDTRDRLFAMFAGAFYVLCLQRLLLALTTETMENQIYLYVLRFLAFLLILWAIIDKNRTPSTKKG